MENTELEGLAAQLGRMVIKGLGPRSVWALKSALSASETEGIAGVCVLRIAAKQKDYTDIMFTVGTVDVISRWDLTG